MSVAVRPTVIEAAHLSKSYGRTRALQDISLEVFEGEIFGLIGPNGAGKTTAMECIEGLRVPDAGRVSVLGLDPFRDVTPLLERIGVQLQEAQLQKRITVREAVDLWSSLYRTPVGRAAWEATARANLAAEVERWSGGTRSPIVSP